MEGAPSQQELQMAGLAPGQRQRKNTRLGLGMEGGREKTRYGKGGGGRRDGWGFGEERSRVLKRWNNWIMCLCQVQNGDPVPLAPPTHTHTPPDPHAPTCTHTHTHRGSNTHTRGDWAFSQTRTPHSGMREAAQRGEGKWVGGCPWSVPGSLNVKPGKKLGDHPV